MNQKLDIETTRRTPQGTMASNPLSRRLLRLALPVVIVLAGSFVTWKMMTSSPTMARISKPREARLVEAITVTAVSQAVNLTLWGEVKPAQEVTLKAQVSGVVEKRLHPLEPGSFVTADEPLLQLERAEYEAALAQKQADLEQARANLELEQGNQAVARSEYDLLGDDAGPAEKKLMLREPQLLSARAAIKSAEAALAAASLNLQRTRITAPFAGVIKERLVNVGSQVAANGELLTLTGTDTAWVEVSVPLNQLRWIRFPDAQGEGGSVVTLHYDQVWSAGQTRKGKVLRLLSDLESSGRMARVLVQVDDPLAAHLSHEHNPPLLMGSFLRVDIEGLSLDDVIVIPANVLHDNDTVWLYQDGQLQVRDVEVAYRDQARVFVRSGLNSGEQLVTSALSTATAGMAIRLKDPAGTAHD